MYHYYGVTLYIWQKCRSGHPCIINNRKCTTKGVTLYNWQNEYSRKGHPLYLTKSVQQKGWPRTFGKKCTPEGVTLYIWQKVYRRRGHPLYLTKSVQQIFEKNSTAKEKSVHQRGSPCIFDKKCTAKDVTLYIWKFVYNRGITLYIWQKVYSRGITLYIWQKVYSRRVHPVYLTKIVKLKRSPCIYNKKYISKEVTLYI